jgi:hypothetical protein
VSELLFLCSLCLFGYIFVVVEEDICVRNCRGLGLCRVVIVGWSVGDEYQGGWGSLGTG